MAYIGNTASTRYVANRAASVYSGDGSTYQFTLEEAVGSDEDILVSVDGVIQEPSVAYTVSSGTTLDFGEASPPSSNAGNNIFVYYLSLAKGSIVHPSNVGLTATTGTFSGAITGGGLLTTGGNIVIPNAGNIGSVGDTDAMSIASDGVVTFTQTPVGAYGTTLATPVATTSGTSVTLTGIPTTATQVIMHFMGVSHAADGGNGDFKIELGTSGGIVTSGYFSTVAATGTSNAAGQSTSAFLIYFSAGAADTLYGNVTLTLADSATHTYTETGALRSGGYVGLSGGMCNLGGALTQIKLTGSGRTFDAGSVSLTFN